MLEISPMGVEKHSKRVENPSKGAMQPEAVFTDILKEMTEIVRDAAGPRTGSAKEQIDLAARRLGISFSRAKSYWYGAIRNISATEAHLLRQKRRQIICDRAARLKAELEILNLRLARLENDE